MSGEPVSSGHAEGSYSCKKLATVCACQAVLSTGGGAVFGVVGDVVWAASHAAAPFPFGAVAAGSAFLSCACTICVIPLCYLYDGHKSKVREFGQEGPKHIPCLPCKACFDLGAGRSGSSHLQADGLVDPLLSSAPTPQRM